MFCIYVIVTPHTRCRLKLLKLERIKDYLILEEEFIKNQERLKPQEEKQEVGALSRVTVRGKKNLKINTSPLGKYKIFLLVLLPNNLSEMYCLITNIQGKINLH